MTTDDWDSKRPTAVTDRDSKRLPREAPPGGRGDRDDQRAARQSGPSRRLVAAVSVVAAMVVVGAGATIGVKLHGNHGSPSPAAAKLQAKPVAKPKPKPKPSGPPKSWHLTFNGTFSGATLDANTWGTCYPWTTGGCTNYGNGSDPELEWYAPSQDQVSGGVLHLVAQRTSTIGRAKDGTAQEYTCRSGMVTSFPGMRFKYGYIQVTAKIPFSKGLWPALWLAAANEKWPPEVDMLEHWGVQPYGKVYFHPLNGARQGGKVAMPGLSSGWHNFAIEWTKTRLTWYYDGTKVFTSTAHIPQQEMYFIGNVADDGAGAGTCSGSMLIKSVKVWQPQA